jgi:cation:H+ antiporter
VTALLFLAALVLLVAGGELLVRGAARLALGLGVTPLVIGLTVVAFGTSAPELAVSVRAALGGQADISIGNVVGSNIFNVLFVLGISAIIVPLSVSTQLVWVDIPIMITVSIGFLLMALNGVVGRAEAVLLVLALAGYIGLQLRMSRRNREVAPTPGTERARPLVNLLLIAFGLALLVLGSHWLVKAAVEIAAQLGATNLVIGLTIVAAGTSMPEVVTSIVAGIRGQRDIAIGNVIGSNIFNLLAVVGVTGILVPGGIPVSASAMAIDIPIMVAAALLCLPIFVGYTIDRWEGSVFLGYYLLYSAFLILDASQHDGLERFHFIVLAIVIPLTLITLLAASARHRFRRRSGR